MKNVTTDWLETYAEVCFAIGNELGKDKDQAPLIKHQYEEGGRGRIWELAESLTNEFEKMHEGQQWDGEWFDAVDDFLEERFNELK